MKKPRSYYLGNILLLASLVGFLSLGYPVVSAYIFPGSEPSKSEESYTLWIPKIKAKGVIIPKVDPWNKEEYSKALKKGIAEAKGFASVGEKGSVFLFAHSSGPPWELTRYNTVFLRLGELDKGDEIIIWKNGKKYLYKVTGKKEVYPSEVSEISKLKGDQLIIQTCTPLGTDWKRLLVFAEEIKS